MAVNMPEDPLARLTAQSVAGVIDSLDRIVAWSKEHAGPLGYSAALYRRATVEVARGIGDGRFGNGPRMERLDVTSSTTLSDSIFRTTRSNISYLYK